MPGHLFIVRGDPFRLACDAWLLPPEQGLHPAEEWVLVPFTPQQGNAERLPRGLGRLPDWLRQHPGGTNRQKPVVVVPAPAGEGERVGTELASLLGRVQEVARRQEVDVVLVAPDRASYAAAQAVRQRHSPPGPEQGDPWPELDHRLRQQAHTLAARAARGQLALFLGAGVGAGMGLPLWNDLLEILAQRAGAAEDERSALRQLNPLDRAAILQKRLKGTAHVQQVICELFTRDRYSLTHGLLANVPCHEVVTTNYDLLFEMAWDALGYPYSALPHSLRKGTRRWVLKMHGSISHPEDIVLTRQDQLGYNLSREALSGVVQAVLLTRHMLFVGFSLNDEHFHQIAETVRRVVRKANHQKGRRSPFGSVLVLERDPLVEELWGHDLAWVNMGADQPSRGDGERDPLAAARRLEVFLDYLLALVPDPAHLLDPRYAGILTGEERALREALLRLQEESRPARNTPAWPSVQRLFDRLGGKR